MILVITNSDDATANYLCQIMEKTSSIFLRIDSDTFTKKHEIIFDGEHCSIYNKYDNQLEPFRKKWTVS